MKLSELYEQQGYEAAVRRLCAGLGDAAPRRPRRADATVSEESAARRVSKSLAQVRRGQMPALVRRLANRAAQPVHILEGAYNEPMPQGAVLYRVSRRVAMDLMDLLASTGQSFAQRTGDLPKGLESSDILLADVLGAIAEADSGRRVGETRSNVLSQRIVDAAELDVAAASDVLGAVLGPWALLAPAAFDKGSPSQSELLRTMVSPLASGIQRNLLDLRSSIQLDLEPLSNALLRAGANRLAWLAGRRARP